MSSITLSNAESFNSANKASFADILSGKNAFYNAPDYVESTKRDFAVTTTLPVSYVWNTQSKIVRIAKEILSFIFFPVFLYGCVHSALGKYTGILPSSTPAYVGASLNDINEARSSINLEEEWKYKRLTVEVDGYEVDAMIVGTASSLGNKRWVLESNGNAEFYEEKMFNPHFYKFLKDVDANGIAFNYPGVGTSSGLPNRFAMAKAYRAILNFLEDKEKGINAKEIIGSGLSIGGGVQGDALNTHELKKGIKYVFIKVKTFSDLATEVGYLITFLLEPFVKLFGWNMGSVESSKKLQAPEIIIQTANVKKTEELTDAKKIVDDGIIYAGSSLARALLEDDSCPKENKTFFGVTSDHFRPIFDTKLIVEKVKYYLNN